MVRKQEGFGTDKQNILWMCEGKVRNITQSGPNLGKILFTRRMCNESKMTKLSLDDKLQNVLQMRRFNPSFALGGVHLKSISAARAVSKQVTKLGKQHVQARVIKPRQHGVRKGRKIMDVAACTDYFFFGVTHCNTNGQRPHQSHNLVVHL
tara:strand:- start:1329 stop:1781 length:453 start_codon:yes stop_codon:yes gene_type:complete